MDIVVQHYGNIASVVSLLISMIGFILTIRDVRRAERAAESAREAAKEAVSRISHRVAANEVGEVLHLIRGVESAALLEDWAGVVGRCTDARSRLSKLSGHTRFGVDDRPVLEEADRVLSQLVVTVQSKRRRGKIKGLTARQFKTLHQISSRLGQLHGRIESQLLES